MEANDISLLGYALLGLLQHEPMSGYDLRKIFLTTPLVSFSDSPGSIYPALRRLEQRGLIRGVVQERAGLRRRRLFRLTAAGAAALKSWQQKPITRENIIRGANELMLRFSFMDQSLGAVEALKFLKELERELADYVPSLRAYLEKHESMMSLSGCLALESGILSYESLLSWTRKAISTYAKRERKER